MARDALTRCPFCGKSSPAEDAHLPKSHKATCPRVVKASPAAKPSRKKIDPRTWVVLRDYTNFRRAMRDRAFFARGARKDEKLGETERAALARSRANDYRDEARECVLEALEAYR